MIGDIEVPLFDLITCLSNTVDMVSPDLSGHHRQVAYVASSIAAELGLPSAAQRQLALAGMLHDIGAFSLTERLSALHFEIESPHRHAELGYMLLNMFEPLASVASVVRFHHVPWADEAGVMFGGHSVPRGSHLLHLADRVAVLIDKHAPVLSQVKSICSRIDDASGAKFVPAFVEAFRSVAAKEYFWLDAISPSSISLVRRRSSSEAIDLNTDGLLRLAMLFSQVIDFRSRFTATHSSGVAATAETIARLAGFTGRECQMMRIAGYLHDLGKLAVPIEILEKPAKLTEAEFDIIRGHTFYTYRTIEAIAGLEQINSWAALHHERLDGKGYPFHVKGGDLPLGSRIMAVADVFTALAEDRPYRKGMAREGTLQILQQMAEDLALDSTIVWLLTSHYDEVNAARVEAQNSQFKDYRGVMQPA